ncbi:HutD/Ves family protein [Paeniglutamicibacter sp. R2-26]|uniref:HutD/Ves family protein n=1 Tax=Paeniglutamicibacter sp. R2-26 TaxID=3144417 RepID=UPI003EE7A78E
MSNPTLATGSIVPLAASPKKMWGQAQGQVRDIAAGTLDADGALVPSTAEEWDWRLSVASIERAGNFTPYDGFDRTLTVITGELLELTIDGTKQAVELYRPLKFPGGSTTSATLPTGEVLALNLITRTGAVRGNVRIVELSKKREQYLFGSQFGVLLQGKAVVLQGDTERAVELRDTVVGGEEDSPRISGRGFMAVVSLDLP